MAKTQEDGNTLPLLAVAAIKGAGGADPQLAELLKQLIEDQLEKRRKEKEKKERLALSAVQAAKDEARMRAEKERNCSHRKQDGRTRLAGQKLSGTGQICLVCQWCAKTFHFPPDPKLAQTAPPVELMPPMDEIGG